MENEYPPQETHAAQVACAANLNIHFHVIALDGVYEKKSTGRLKFYAAQAPTNETIQNLVCQISTKINNLLIKKGCLEKVEDMVLVGNTDDIFSDSSRNSFEDIHLPAQAASVTHRIAFGPNAGQPIRRLKSHTSLWPSEQNFKSSSTACVTAGGYSVHAETAINSHERDRLEKLVRYMARPAISDERVIIEGPQSIRVKLKSTWRDGTESLLFTPSEFLERLVALIPAPKFHTTRYYGVLASRSPHRRYLPDKPTPLINVEHWVSPCGRLTLLQPAPGSCLIATIATTGREQMSTTAGRTNEGPFHIRKVYSTLLSRGSFRDRQKQEKWLVWRSYAFA